MTEIQIATMILGAFLGAGVVFTRDPASQVVVLGLYGFSLVLLFVSFQAPDVSLSAIVVSATATPMMILLTLARVRDTKK